MTKNESLEQLSGVGVIAYDLRLFLDVNPTHEQALADFKHITAHYRELIKQHEQAFGPLTGGSDVDGTWATTPFPWQLNKGGHA